MYKVLLIEEEINLGTRVADVLETHDFSVHFLTSKKDIIKDICDFQPHVIILDICMNERTDEFETAGLIRRHCNTPIIFTTAEESTSGINTAFNISNTDYIRKPYRTMEIIKRIERLLELKKADYQYTIGQYIFVPALRTLQHVDQIIDLNNLESAVLHILCENKCGFIHKDMIIKKVWNVNDPRIKDRSLYNILSSLRKHLHEDGSVEIESKNKLGIRLKTADL